MTTDAGARDGGGESDSGDGGDSGDGTDNGARPTCEGLACIPADLSCTDAPVLETSAVLSVDYRVSGVIPLCSGLVLAADQPGNRLVLLDMWTAHELYAFELAGSPTSIVLDTPMRQVLITFAGKSTIGVLDLDSGDVREIDVGTEAYSIALGPPGIAFATVVLPPTVSRYQLAIIDLASSAVSRQTDHHLGYARSLVRFDPVYSRIFLGDVGISPSELVTFDFDLATHTLGPEHAIESGDNGSDLMVSSDGLHLAYTCGGGNYGRYTIADYSTSDLTPHGAWDPGSYPRSASFSPDSELVAAFGMRLRLFRVDSHMPLGPGTALPTCPYAAPKVVRWTPDGKAVVVVTLCGPASNDGSRILYQPI